MSNDYRLNFSGRNSAFEKYKQNTTKQLKLNTKLSKNIDTTKNWIIKGDNLDSLKILKNYFLEKIKCIYIDPPYHTNKKFTYSDKFDNHNDWLSFIYPRLLLAKDLLQNDGIIFISIDDNEQANLKLLCDEIFGEKNFINNFIWLIGKGKKDKWSRTTQQYILCYAKNKSVLPAFTETKLAQGNFSNPDNDPRGAWLSGSISFDEKRSNKKRDTYFTITSPSGIEWKRQWQVESKEEMDNLLSDNRIYFGKAPEYKNVPRKKIFPFDKNQIIPSNLLDNHGTTLSAQNELNKLFDMQPKQNIFDNPKPVKLIKHLISISTNENDIILDFFAGSGTTGHSVLELNSENNSNRKFILCQSDEPIKENTPAYQFCKNNNLPTVISSITIERLKRVSGNFGFKVFDMI